MALVFILSRVLALCPDFQSVRILLGPLAIVRFCLAGNAHGTANT